MLGSCKQTSKKSRMIICPQDVAIQSVDSFSRKLPLHPTSEAKRSNSIHIGVEVCINVYTILYIIKQNIYILYNTYRIQHINVYRVHQVKERKKTHETHVKHESTPLPWLVDE